VFARGADGHVQHASWTGSAWTPFAALDPQEIVDGEPSPVMNHGGGGGPGPEVFARQPGGQVAHAWWDGGAWTSFAPMPAQAVASDPLGWVRPDGTAVVLAVDAAGNLVETARDGSGSWGAWTVLASGVDPCAAAAEPQVDGGSGDAGGDAASGDGAADGRSPADAGGDADGGEGRASSGDSAGGCACEAGTAAPAAGASSALSIALLAAGTAFARRRKAC
jgi:hypothetical protein